MKTLLNITRSAEDGDEIANRWFSEDNDWATAAFEEDGAVRFLQRKKGDCCVLAVHPTLLEEIWEDEEALKRRKVDGEEGEGRSIHEVMRTAASNCTLAVLGHVRGSMSSIQKDVKQSLPGVDVSFYAKYTSSGRNQRYGLYEDLAGASPQTFEDAFVELWKDISPDRSLEVKLNLLHELLVPPSSKKEIEAKGEVLMKGVRNDPEASEEEERRCKQAWEEFANDGPQDYSDEPFDAEYCGSEEKEGMLPKLRDELLATAS